MTTSEREFKHYLQEADIILLLLRHHRKAANMSVDDVGIKMKTTRSIVARLESGASTMTLDRLLGMISAIGMSATHFFSEFGKIRIFAEERSIKVLATHNDFCDHSQKPDCGEYFLHTSLQAMILEYYSQQSKIEVLEKFTIWWRDGTRSVIEGVSIDDAFTKAGYGAGAVKAVDWYDRGDVDTHYWCTATKNWLRRTPIINPNA